MPPSNTGPTPARGLVAACRSCLPVPCLSPPLGLRPPARGGAGRAGGDTWPQDAGRPVKLEPGQEAWPFLTPPAAGGPRRGGALTVKGFSKLTYIHRRFPPVHPELLFSYSQSLEAPGLPGPGRTPAHSGCPGPGPRHPPSLPGPSCCGSWGGGWTLPERGSGKGTLTGLSDAEPRGWAQQS